MIIILINFYLKNIKLNQEYLKLKKKYKPINNISEEIEKLELQIENLKKKNQLIDLEFNRKNIYFDKIIEIEKEITTRKENSKQLSLEIKTTQENLYSLSLDFKKKGVLYKSIEDIEKSISSKLIELNSLKESYKEKKEIYNNIIREINIYEENLEDLSYGLYNPHFNFDDSEKYKNKIIEIRQKQKDLIKTKKAVICQTKWDVNGSTREGTKMTNRNIKLMLRAFNGECDSSILKVRWNNILNLEKRIEKSFELINRMGETTSIEIQEEYLSLKIDELRVTHEFKEKKHNEREERKSEQRELREEIRVQKEIELAKKEAEKEEKRYLKLLEKAKLEIDKKHGFELEKYNQRISELENQLLKARELKERAISRAQITKSGYVYIISNIGAFGKDIYKIGMTRRLEPIERVYELSGASVPFKYDIHGMVYSENAPALENKLHKKFNKQRVNKANNRKEFFNITIDEIEKEIYKIDNSIELIKTSEARQYRETLLMKKKEQKTEIEDIFNKYPDEI
ncbi:DUF4041 domain-containing protein [uncultured Polaribacter sp.]|uniref:DUF4041 domain-containing protein n=1 Tax=uncultured Polaribacter sp. TaxID=174711 RepID=UPI00261A146D|nr:DUF4041 domain-containing protein [uncultured Polaribacter sp.]